MKSAVNAEFISFLHARVKFSESFSYHSCISSSMRSLYVQARISLLFFAFFFKMVPYDCFKLRRAKFKKLVIGGTLMLASGLVLCLNIDDVWDASWMLLKAVDASRSLRNNYLTVVPRGLSVSRITHQCLCWRMLNQDNTMPITAFPSKIEIIQTCTLTAIISGLSAINPPSASSI